MVLFLTIGIVKIKALQIQGKYRVRISVFYIHLTEN